MKIIVASTKLYVEFQKLLLLSKCRKLTAHRVRCLRLPTTGDEQRKHQSNECEWLHFFAERLRPDARYRECSFGSS